MHQPNSEELLATDEDSDTQAGKQKRARGIYLLPNLLTTAALFGGFFAILSAINQHYETAVLAIFIAMVLDGLDGRVARMTHTQTDFGAEYDSLSDMVAFGLAPSMLVYLWAMKDMGKLGWFAAFVFTAAAALRLARFNTQVETADKRYFQGLPSPAAAAVIAASVWMAEVYSLNAQILSIPATLLTIVTGLLMVSNVRYYSFKEFDPRGRIPFMALVVIMLGFAVLFLHPPVVLFTVFMLYALSGPVMMLSKRKAEQPLSSVTDQAETLD